MTESKLRIGLVGCGQIADAHLQQIDRIPSVEMVAVCDLEPLLARQAAERFRVPAQYTSIDEMVRYSCPDVVHITTPVHTHAPIAMQLLESGVHVYVEKPFTVDLPEALQVFETANRTGSRVCLGHDQLFDPAWQECERVVASGVIGEVQHVESFLGYPIDGPFGRNVVADPNHWVRRLPGGLFQNTISHPLYRVTEFLRDAHPHVEATWFNRLPDIPFPTEMRVHLRGEKVTGGLIYTSTTKPRRRVTRIYGTEGGLEVDLDTQLVRLDECEALPGAFGRIEAPFGHLRTSLRNLKRNAGRFLRGEFHYFDGMKALFESFYEAVRTGEQLPVSYDEGIRVTGLMDRIFEICRETQSKDFQRGQSTDVETAEPEVILNLIRETGELVTAANSRLSSLDSKSDLETTN